MIEWLFTFLVFYLLYKLIFDFIIPVSRASVHVRNRVNEMNRQQQQFTSNRNYTNTNQTKSGEKPPADEYIDFEEIK